MDFDPKPVDLQLTKATRAAAVAAELFGLAQKTCARSASSAISHVCANGTSSLPFASAARAANSTISSDISITTPS